MATITREGKTITLTDEEIRSILHDEHRTAIRFMYEDAVKECEEEKWISFSPYFDCEFAEYVSEADARADFIEKLTDDYIEADELYERDPEHYRRYTDAIDDVLKLAEDFGYRIDEE